MGVQLKNNASTITAAAISSTDTTIMVATGTGAAFPSLGAGDYFFATLQGVGNQVEIVRVTARADDMFTVTRGQEGTLAIPFPANSRFELRVTVENVLSKFDDLDFLLL